MFYKLTFRLNKWENLLEVLVGKDVITDHIIQAQDGVSCQIPKDCSNQNDPNHFFSDAQRDPSLIK